MFNTGAVSTVAYLNISVLSLPPYVSYKATLRIGLR